MEPPFKKIISQGGITTNITNYSLEEYERHCIELVSYNFTNISNIENPSQTVQLIAVHENCIAISLIKNPTELVQALAVRLDGTMIQYINEPSEYVQQVACEQNGEALVFIIQKGITPSYAVQMNAVKQCGESILYLLNLDGAPTYITPSSDIVNIALNDAVFMIKQPHMYQYAVNLIFKDNELLKNKWLRRLTTINPTYSL